MKLRHASGLPYLRTPREEALVLTALHLIARGANTNPVLAVALGWRDKRTALARASRLTTALRGRGLLAPVPKLGPHAPQLVVLPHCEHLRASWRWCSLCSPAARLEPSPEASCVQT